MVSLNSDYFILLKNRDLNQIRLFAKTILPIHKIDNFVKLYKAQMSKNKHGYLLIDVDQDTDSKLMIRSNICNSAYEKAFLI